MFKYVTRCDSLGRLLIPKPVRTQLGIDGSTKIGIVLQSNGELILKPISSACVVCGSEQEHDLHFWDERQVYLCSSCCAQLDTKLRRPMRRINAYKAYRRK